MSGLVIVFILFIATAFWLSVRSLFEYRLSRKLSGRGLISDVEILQTVGFEPLPSERLLDAWYDVAQALELSPQALRADDRLIFLCGTGPWSVLPDFYPDQACYLNALVAQAEERVAEQTLAAILESQASTASNKATVEDYVRYLAALREAAGEPASDAYDEAWSNIIDPHQTPTSHQANVNELPARSAAGCAAPWFTVAPLLVAWGIWRSDAFVVSAGALSVAAGFAELVSCFENQRSWHSLDEEWTDWRRLLPLLHPMKARQYAERRMEGCSSCTVKHAAEDWVTPVQLGSGVRSLLDRVEWITIEGTTQWSIARATVGTAPESLGFIRLGVAASGARLLVKPELDEVLVVHSAGEQEAERRERWPTIYHWLLAAMRPASALVETERCSQSRAR